MVYTPYCGNSYNSFNGSAELFYHDWYDIPGSIYQLYQGTFLCPTANASVTIFKNNLAHNPAAPNLGTTTWAAADKSFDNENLCISSWILDCVVSSCSWECYFDLVCGSLADVYVDSSSGNDVYCGNSVANAVKTFARAYSVLSSGGTIHVLNSTADFSAETVTLNKSFSIDLNGASGNFYGPKAG